MFVCRGGELSVGFLFGTSGRAYGFWQRLLCNFVIHERRCLGNVKHPDLLIRPRKASQYCNNDAEARSGIIIPERISSALLGLRGNDRGRQATDQILRGFNLVDQQPHLTRDAFDARCGGQFNDAAYDPEIRDIVDIDLVSRDHAVLLFALARRRNHEYTPSWFADPHIFPWGDEAAEAY
jgi:hypothetical protein